MTMEGNIVHMVGGTEDNSYAANSAPQRRLSQDAISVVKEAVEALVRTIPSSRKYLVVADLGCSTGNNSLSTFSEIADSISKTCAQIGQTIPEIQLLLNDLPRNDFNTLLGPVLSSYKERMNKSGITDGLMPFYTAAVSGSFYERLFPSSSVHFINSSSSLHWLSQVPPGLNNKTEGTINKGSIYISGENHLVSKLYLRQFERDFSLFLKHRSEELCSEGHMSLTLFGRGTAEAPGKDTAVHLSWLGEALDCLVSKGLLKALDVESFNLPLYFPTMEEVMLIVQKEGSFDLLNNIIIESSYSDVSGITPGEADDKTWMKVAMSIRAALGPLLASYFSDSIMDELFSTLSEILAQHFYECEHKWINLAITLKKKKNLV